VKRNYCANLNSVIKAMAVRGGQQKPILGKKNINFYVRSCQESKRLMRAGVKG